MGTAQSNVTGPDWGFLLPRTAGVVTTLRPTQEEPLSLRRVP